MSFDKCVHISIQSPQQSWYRTLAASGKVAL